MSHYQNKLSFREKAGYSLGDGAANLVFQLLMAYQFMFFTQVMGLSSKAAGILFLIGRFFDAFTDPAMGIVADRTKTKWGRFRPWILWSALPFAGIFWMTFTSPGWSPTGQTVYAYVMYFLLMAIYTVNNVPYSALNGVMTGDVDERTSLSTYRFAAVVVVQFLVVGLTLPLVAKFGQGDDAKGWSITVGLFAVATIFLFLICFFSARERVEPDPKEKSSARQDMLDTFKNRPWFILFIATLMIFTMLAVRGGALALYMQDYVDQTALQEYLVSLGLQQSEGSEPTGFRVVLNALGYLIDPDASNVPDVAYALFSMLGTMTMLIGVFFSKPLSKLFGKRAVFVGALLITAVSTIWLYFIPANRISMMMWQSLSWGLCYGPTIPLLWSMIADTADYSEWKTGRRATGFVFAGVVFALKFGLGIGGFVQGMIYDVYGYESNMTVLTERAMQGLRLSATMYPAGFILVAAILLLFYPISKKLNYQIGDELAQRRLERKEQSETGSAELDGEKCFYDSFESFFSRLHRWVPAGIRPSFEGRFC
jgi:Na+/melibiose symporter-like transporter